MRNQLNPKDLLHRLLDGTLGLKKSRHRAQPGLFQPGVANVLHDIGHVVRLGQRGCVLSGDSSGCLLNKELQHKLRDAALPEAITLFICYHFTHGIRDGASSYLMRLCIKCLRRIYS
jgi:hypothetical protein